MPIGVGSLGNLGPIIEKALPVFKMLGLDPTKFVNKLGRNQVHPAMMAATPVVVAFYKEKGISPATKAINPEGERQIIRGIMYRLGKVAFDELLPEQFDPLTDELGDFFRDQHDDAVVAEIMPKLTPQTSIEDAVIMIRDAYFERIF